jgi:two-component system, cell cycle sensor histidine kinase and response regulator CckA
LLDLNAVVSNLEQMLRRIIRENIVIVTCLSPNLDCVKADPLQIEQILMNLTVNARDAMPNGGRLNIETHNAYVMDDMAATRPDMVSGNYVVLAVRDTGVLWTMNSKPISLSPSLPPKRWAGAPDSV